MNPSRRVFSAGGLAAAASAFAVDPVKSSALPAASHINSGRAAAFVKKIGIRYPIAQAVIGTGSSPLLTAAVSEAGGLGGMGISLHTEAGVREAIKATRAATNAPFAVGYILPFGSTTLAVALEAGAPVVQFSWGTPTVQQVALLRSFGAKFGMQISNPLGAKYAIDVGVDYITCQGQEAGGHIQAQSSWRDQLGEVLVVAGETPVLVAGGLGDGKALREVLSLGASGGIFGTRFVATKESPAHDEYKRLLVRARPSDTALTVCFERGWSNTLQRALRNKTLDEWEAAGSPSPGKRPGENDTVAQAGGKPVSRYFMGGPSNQATGNVTEMAMWAGQGVGSIRDLPAAGDLVRRLWAECTGNSGTA